MMQATSAAASGLQAQQERLDIIAANIANVNTVGYKSARADFKDALYSRMQNPADGLSVEENLLKGSGVILSGTGRDFTDGAAQSTGVQTDMALSGSGFFMLQDDGGDAVYTRNGNFSLSEENGSLYLVNADGNYVLSDQGTRIQVPGDGSFHVSADGTLSHEGEAFSKLAVVQFDNPEGLDDVGNSCYRETAASGGAYRASDAGVTQGSLENSNVDLGQEMTLLMRAQRAYSLAGKALQTADEMDGLANNMR